MAVRTVTASDIFPVHHLRHPGGVPGALVGRLAGPGGPAGSGLTGGSFPWGKTISLSWAASTARPGSKGPSALESGQSVPAALTTVRTLWDAGRVQLFDRMITPEFARIVAEDRAPSQYTFAERMALAKAWRGFAAGLETPRK